MKITKFTNSDDFEYINCGVREKVKYNRIWEFDKVKNDWYSFTSHLYLTEYERMNGIK